MSAPPVEFTGERFVPECTGEIWAEHWHRYLFARHFVVGRDVLDAASGEGYGSAWLARGARSVVGLDVDAPTIGAARKRYVAPNLRFETGSVAAMPFADASFDCVVSFETLEHLGEQEAMLTEIRRVLRPEGCLLISTPNRVEYTERRDFHNEFHVRELDREQFRNLLARNFPAQQWYGQKLLFNSAIWPLDGSAKAPLRWIALDERPPAMPEPMYYIACAGASDASLPRLAELTMLPDPAEEMYREYERTVTRTQALETLVREREQIVAERDRQLAEFQARADHLERLALERGAIIAERDGQLAANTARAARMESLIAEREAVVIERDRQLEATNARAAQLETLLSDRERIIAERDAALAAVNARMLQAEKLLAHRESVIVERDAQLADAADRVAALEQESRELLREVARRAGLRWWLTLPWLRLRARADSSVAARKAGKA